MGKINVLSFAVANLIAAGEVVDRPASVIKELLENAIDAGATRITVEIQHGGITFMRVADNGCGIAKEDLPIAIKRHATSKIKDASDLDAIFTLGFRGEALAAIAAVSDLRIITKTAEEPFGHVLEAKAGEVLSVSDQGAPAGTTVIVENLFGNVPARRKFLKKDVSEAIAVSTYTEKIALSHPEIALRLIVDGNVKLDTAGDGELKSVMYAVFGREFVSKMIPVQTGNEDVRVEGYIGRSDNVRPKRNYENFFINGRYINSRTAAAALEQAYTSFIPPEKFPCCVLSLHVNPATVDVNVHPAKLEVKFSNEKPVFEAVYYAVRTALENNVVRPELQVGRKTPPAKDAFVPIEEGKREPLCARQVTIDHVPAASSVEPFTRMSAAEYAERFAPEQGKPLRAASPVNYSTSNSASVVRTELSAGVNARETSAKDFSYLRKTSAESVPASDAKTGNPIEPLPDAASRVAPPDAPPVEPPAAELIAKPVWRMIGEAFNCYIIVECDDKLLLIDKHAAHERILFEDLKKKLKSKEHTSQLLLVPLPLPLSDEDIDTLTLYREEVLTIGFSYTAKGHMLSVNEIPTGLSFDAAAELLQSLAPALREGTGNAELARDIVFEKALYQSACKAAVKGSRSYPPEYAQWICDKLAEIPDITVCPHGRPVAMVLTHASLNRQFERT